MSFFGNIKEEKFWSPDLSCISGSCNFQNFQHIHFIKIIYLICMARFGLEIFEKN